MSRRSGTHIVNLMPLLDVLLCTMGTLIVILGVINREARFHPAKRTGGTATTKHKEMVEAGEDLELRIDQVSAAREKTLADLEMSRSRLSSLEEQSRRFEDQLRELQAAAKKVSATADTSASQHDQMRVELMQLDTQRMKLEGQLQKARSQSRHRQPAYAVVPFEGLYKTSRRPIYIECRADSVILQPEGIAFTPTDFLGPGGPGNPLASALRAAQEYWRAAPRPAPDIANEPYPLLLVRPDGIIAYYLVRDAMSSWDAEFGYELVGQDWKLDFPVEPSPQLKNLEDRAVAEARQRQQWLAQVSPDLFSRKPSKVQYHVSPMRGGVVRDGGPSLGNDPFADDPLGGFGRTAGNGNSMSGFPGGTGGAFSRGSSQGTGDNPFGRSNALADPRGNSAFESVGSLGTGSANSGFGDKSTSDSEGSNRSQLGTGSGGSRYANFGGGDLKSGSSAGTSGGGHGSSAGGGRPSTSEYGGVALPGAPSGPTGDIAGGSNLAAGTLGSPEGTFNGRNTGSGGSSPGDSIASAGNTASSAMGQPGMGSADPTSSTSGMPSLSFNVPQKQYPEQQPSERQRSSGKSLADQRGRNWALPTSSTASVAIQRPIRIECWADRLIMLPDSRDEQPEVIPLGEQTEQAVDQLVGAVRTYTKSWGMAGRGMYWKPQLVLQVYPNADARAADLQALLANSGWDVKRR